MASITIRNLKDETKKSCACAQLKTAARSKPKRATSSTAPPRR